jgi:hypothetical protein
LEAAGLGLFGGTRGIGDGTRGILFLLVWAETLRFILISHVKYLMKRGVKLAGAEAVSGSMYCTVQVLNLFCAKLLPKLGARTFRLRNTRSDRTF